ncbi:aldo/keto reductase [Actinospica durhamensis]|uniref:Aldo/keto reductase n=1 Tax=Actinospica durhamensis TaxID=1508375 RepID=A0A941EXB2_9ACTN|nr:aldo/keto reductase [Actinospica durhamensis]MBR7838042.1 aldo/keto reductase [Actinospica durhamensis]
MSKLGTTDLDVYGLCLGGNVFGWTADEEASFAVLDAYAAAGGNFIDTADAYSAWVNGEGGQSETILGRWFAARGNRSSIVLATKVSRKPSRLGLSAANIHAAADESLQRLGTDYIDLYYAHHDDESVPLEETLGAFDELVRSGKVRHIAASNYTAPRLAEALAVSQREGFARYSALQNHYNLLERADFEDSLAPLLLAESIPALPYFGLARGFLAGKYRPGIEVDSARAQAVTGYQNDRGWGVLETLDGIASAHGVPVAAVSLAWLRSQPAVAAPIASARTVEQLADLIASVELELSGEELAALDTASRVTAGE